LNATIGVLLSDDQSAQNRGLWRLLISTRRHGYVIMCVFLSSGIYTYS